jgi:hypothetical protein
MSLRAGEAIHPELAKKKNHNLMVIDFKNLSLLSAKKLSY